MHIFQPAFDRKRERAPEHQTAGRPPMGFELHVAEGPSIAIRAKKKRGAPVTINLESLLRVSAAERNMWLKKNTDQEVTGTALAALKSAVTVDDGQAALKNKIHLEATPVAVRVGAMVFQPSPERRRSGSHYTPRALTKPIMEAALEPVLKELGPAPRPEQILALKVCDPAMGSGGQTCWKGECCMGRRVMAAC